MSASRSDTKIHAWGIAAAREVTTDRPHRPMHGGRLSMEPLKSCTDRFDNRYDRS